MKSPTGASRARLRCWRAVNNSARNRTTRWNITTFINPGAIGNTQIGGSTRATGLPQTAARLVPAAQRQLLLPQRQLQRLAVMARTSLRDRHAYGPVVASSFVVLAARLQRQFRTAPYRKPTTSTSAGVSCCKTACRHHHRSLPPAADGMAAYTVRAARHDVHGTASMPVLTDIYDANAASSSNNQLMSPPPDEQCFANTTARTTQPFRSSLGSPTINRTSSNAGIHGRLPASPVLTYAVTLLANVHFFDCQPSNGHCSL
jgi:hypothetical protein